MNTISDFPYFEVQFNKEGALHDEQERRQILDFISKGKVTDLFVISHGWNNDMDEARNLYKNFFTHMRAQINNNRSLELGAREFGILGVFWPSKKFADEDLIPSGAANLGDEISEEDKIRQQLESLKGVFDNPNADLYLERAKELVDKIENSEGAAVKFVNLIRSLPNKEEVNSEDNTDEFFNLSGEKLVEKLIRPNIPITSPEEMGGAADLYSSASVMNEGEAASFDIFGGVTSAIRNALNFTTYYQMKERAGIVGRRGAYQLLSQIREISPELRMHFIGHSFGGRLVTSIAHGPEGAEPLYPKSMTLLQAAFSHHGFAENFDGGRDGFFRKVLKEEMVKGPILVTHSIKDVAVGMAYPIASKLSGDDAATFGGPKSRFGGIGRNGAQFTPEADNSTSLGPITIPYQFQSGKLYNLKADSLIMDHSDVTKAEIVHAVLCAVTTN